MSQVTIDALEEMLAQAREGKIIGFVAACLDDEHVGSYMAAGKVGGFSMLGALTAVKFLITETQLE